MNDNPRCNHLKVEYRPFDHGGGKHTDRWVCVECGDEFWPMNWHRIPPQLEIYGSGGAVPSDDPKKR